MRARPPLDDSEARKIRRLAGARHPPADWSERARIIALSWDGLAVPAIAARADCHENAVGDHPAGPGTARRLARDAGGELSADDERRQAVNPGRLDPGGPGRRHRRGTQPGTADPAAEKVRLRRTRSWAASTDPEFAPKRPASWSPLHSAAGGQVVTMCAPSRNSAAYQAFLQLAEHANPEGAIYVVTDNLSSHNSKSTRAWLEGHPRIRNAFIPKGAC